MTRIVMPLSITTLSPRYSCLLKLSPCVTVQVVKTSITPQLATSERVRAAKTEPLHPAGRLHMRRCGTPRRYAAVASALSPPASYFRQSASPLRSVCQSSPCARARRDGSISRPCYWSVPHLRLARTSTTPGAASGCPDTSRRSWAHHTGCPLPTVAPPLGEAESCRTETSSVAVYPRVPDATTQTSGAPAPARRHQSPLSLHHGRAWLRNPAVSAPNRAAATAPGTSCRHYSDPSPRCPQTAHPTAHGPPGHHGTAAPHTPSPNSSPPPITTRACPLDASWSRRGGPPLARAHTCGLPRLAPRAPLSWPALMG